MKHSDPDQLPLKPVLPKRDRGKRAYLAGLAAENSVMRRYQEQGCVIAAQRWRGQGGEIDLICVEGDVIVFVEVKKARSHVVAIQSLSEAQMLRIHAAASEYLGTTPKGELSEVRFDLALVDGAGVVKVMENAFGHF